MFGIKNVFFVNGFFLNLGCNIIINVWEGCMEEEELYIYCNYIDYNFFDFFEIELVEGRNFLFVYFGDIINYYLFNEVVLW